MSTTDTDELLAYYQAELAYLREQGVEFAAVHPRVARRLELSRDECPDPHVERLIESFAFLTARIQRALDDDFPESAAALLGVLYPHYLAPVPSMTVARFEVDPTQNGLTTGHRIPRETPLFAQTGEGVLCRFRTTADAVLWPISVEQACFESPARHGAPAGVQTVLRIRLRALSDPPPAPDRLRFYLNGEPREQAALYELLFAHLRDVVVVPQGGAAVRLGAEALRNAGFARDEAALPAPEHAHPGHRLLQEYFAFPRKFFFAELCGLDRVPPAPAWDVLLMLDHRPPQWLAMGPEKVPLGCAPVVNLFRRTTEPLRLDHRTAEYRLVPDLRREPSTEIHSVDSVWATDTGQADPERIEPLYSFTHARRGRVFWHGRRAATGRRDLPGTDMRISFVDPDFHPALPERRTVWAQVLCTNRRLAEQLPAGPHLQIEQAAPLHRIHVLHEPTAAADPPLGGGALWRLVSQLSLNQATLADATGVDAVRETLRLHGAWGGSGAASQVEGVFALETRPRVHRMARDPWRGLCRGTEVTLTLDEERFAGGSAFLLGAVLARWFALHAGVNAFAETVVRSRQRDGEWKRWPPLAGEQCVL